MRHNAVMEPVGARGAREGFAIEAVYLDGPTVCLQVTGTGDEAACPACGAIARHVHDESVA